MPDHAVRHARLRDLARRVVATLARVALALGVLAGPVQAAAVSVERLQGRPFTVTLDCGAPVAPDAQRVRIEPPPGGWPAWGQSVLVLDAPPGLVVMQRGDERRCGLTWDARTNDARLRSGVGAQFRPGEGVSAPIEVIAPSGRGLGWTLTVRYGDPAAVQREDTVRFALRVGGFAVLAAMLLSSMLLFANVRDRASLVFALTIAAFTLWIGLRTGLAAWPRPWLPSAEAVRMGLMLLPPIGLVGVWSVALTYARAERAFPALAASHGAAAALVGTACVLWLLWPEGRDLVYPTLRVLVFAALLLILPLMLVLLHRGHRGALAVLIGMVPLLVVLGPIYDGALRPWRAEAVLLGGAWFAITMTIAMSQRIGALRRQRDRLRALAERDALTGLPNRRAVDEVLPRRIDEARAQGLPLSVVFVDLDHFKLVNDRHGHAVGDEVLVEAARRLSGRLRGGEFAGRQGGEEFVVLLPGADRERARALAERLRAEIADRPFATSVGEIALTASFGVAALAQASPRQPRAAAALLARADRAMYAAKQAGRNRVEVAPD